jgi:type II secretory pathway component PulL
VELFPGEKNIVNENYQLKSHLKDLKNREEFLIGVKPLDVFMALAQIERDGARFYEVNIERGKLSFRGEAGSLSSVQQIRERLNKYFDDVSISASETSVQGTTAFTITARERKV